jgi:hypothetical protein
MRTDARGVLACIALMSTACASAPFEPDPDFAWTGAAVACDGRPLPRGWPNLKSSEEVLAVFLGCVTPAAFVAMHQGLDMARVLESLDDWDAVRLGALGPLDEQAARRLNRKRAAFLVTATERFGVARAEVFALFILHSSFDDDLRAVLHHLAGDKQLGETLGSMPTARRQLHQRGLPLDAHPERAERPGDVLRGLGRAGRDALASSETSSGARYLELTKKREQLPPPYAQALDDVERALMEQHFATGNVLLGSFDHLTFGVPLGFFHLMAGTARGTASLTAGHYEQASRELAPAALVVVLYARGKTPAGPPRLDSLQERLGASAVREVFQQLRARRENAYLAAEWGEAGVSALHETRGNAARAQALLAEAHRERARPQ